MNERPERRKGDARQKAINISVGVLIAVIGTLIIMGIGFFAKMHLTIERVGTAIETIKNNNRTHHGRMNSIQAYAKEAKEMAIIADERSKRNTLDIMWKGGQ